MRKRPNTAAFRVASALVVALAIALAVAWERAAQARQEPPPWLQVLFLVTFAAGFFQGQASVAHENGWTEMAVRYRARARPKGRFLSQQVTRIGDINEGGLTRLIVVPDGGLYLAPAPVFRFMRSPLLIPWRDIGWVRERKELWYRVWELDLGGITSIRIRKKAYEALKGFVPAPGIGLTPSPVGAPPPPIE